MKIVKGEPLHPHSVKDARHGFLELLFYGQNRERPDFNRRMFDEDFARIFHHSDRHSGALFDITSSNYDLTERLLKSVVTRYGPHACDKTIREWAQEIARSLMWSGQAYFYRWDDPESDEFKIRSFGSSGVSRFLGATFQWVPRHTERHWDRDDEEKPRELRLLDKRRVMHFTLPKSLRRMLRTQNRTLATIDRHQYEATHFQPQATHENPNPTTYFDFMVWRDNQDRVFYRSTRQTGWNGRKYDGAKRSDFFDCHRQIRFRRNQLVLRDGILNQIRSELTRVGREYDGDYVVDIAPTAALPKIDQLDDLESRLKREEAGFTEVIDFCLKR
ncbi:hypothetical protein JF546_05425 [Nitratireductor aquimarinus]|uniref:hypothetical protein n=1 Tax=Nitratireductor aquimarinus TaxID=889300 RepID=UPI001A8E5DD2|nr:hypothetical protein [Nitratireductor aquimarinus]MBN8242442.1 hypothetical protein [Nitratireductor aquimarinus]MBY6130829.1 hypothetical protein [Nitratireductor aquimarinus]MCA1302416.1 hypothetical protein [Nitratireductor aquimarinus]